MIDEQKLRELAEQFICHPVSRSITEVEQGGEAIKELLDELATLRQERTAWRVTAENAEAAVKQARIDALEEAKQACDAISADRWSLYKGRAPYSGREPGRADPDTQGQSDGADACAASIESLKGKTP